jgi:hypothetical protein
MPDATIGVPVKDPLVGPLAAIASGILVARFVPFHSPELFAAIGALLLLGMVALWRRYWPTRPVRRRSSTWKGARS